jgi:hypothetical protein
MKVTCSSSSLNSFAVLTYALENPLNSTAFTASSIFDFDNDGDINQIRLKQRG